MIVRLDFMCLDYKLTLRIIIPQILPRAAQKSTACVGTAFGLNLDTALRQKVKTSSNFFRTQTVHSLIVLPQAAQPVFHFL